MGRDQIDLSHPISPSLVDTLKNYQYVLICAAITDVEKCFQDRELSERVNVSGMRELLDLIKKAGAIPVFFSSDYVFANKVAFHQEQDECAPETHYGRQKLAIEQYLEANFERYLIFRTSKLMSTTRHPKNILFPMVRDLSVSKPLRCFEDQWFNPVFVEDIAKVIAIACRRNLSGIYHLGTRRIFTRYELGTFLATSLGFDPALIQSMHMSDIKFSEKRPTHNTLDCRKIESALDFRFTEIEEALGDIRLLTD